MADDKTHAGSGIDTAPKRSLLARLKALFARKPPQSPNSTR